MGHHVLRRAHRAVGTHHAARDACARREARRARSLSYPLPSHTPTKSSRRSQPYLFNHLVNGNYQAYSSWEFWCVFFLTPLPFILNSYWFYLLVTGVLKHLSKRAQSAQVERARLRKAL